MDWGALAIGIGAAVAVLLALRFAGVDGERGPFAIILGAIASFYLVFAIETGVAAIIGWHALVSAVFVGIAVLGARMTLWWIVGGLVAHGLFDLAEGIVDPNPAPEWWPAFCLGFDLAAAAGLAWLLVAPAGLRTERPES